MKKRTVKRLAIILGVVVALLVMAIPVFADTVENVIAPAPVAEAAEKADITVPVKAIACAVTIAVAAAVGAIAMAMTSKAASENIARQPEAAGDIRTNAMLSLVFLETLVIYALLTVILIIFVL
ncbi:MAG: ATP synthase F0 subunit C [Clostridia bacterium]|nr:ATP synthase F0 subunit C [Clostridia bacterium]